MFSFPMITNRLWRWCDPFWQNARRSNAQEQTRRRKHSNDEPTIFISNCCVRLELERYKSGITARERIVFRAPAIWRNCW
jgi:hypothetical protein